MQFTIVCGCRTTFMIGVDRVQKPDMLVCPNCMSPSPEAVLTQMRELLASIERCSSRIDKGNIRMITFTGEL